jgi:hypothetical protein
MKYYTKAGKKAVESFRKYERLFENRRGKSLKYRKMVIRRMNKARFKIAVLERKNQFWSKEYLCYKGK